MSNTPANKEVLIEWHYAPLTGGLIKIVDG